MFKGGWVDAVTQQLGLGMPLYNLLYVVGIIFFAYFYTAIIFNPDDVAENMRKYGGFVPGIRPGKRTAEYIDTILTRITLAGAIYLALIALLPHFLISGFKVAPIPFIGEWLDATLPKFITEGHERAVLLRRHVAADRRRRGDGHRAAGRVAADHAALRRLHEEDADPGTTGRSGRTWRSNLDHARTAGRGKGHAGGAVRPGARASRRSRPATSCARRCTPATEIGLRAKAIMDRGELVSDDVMIGIVRERLERPDAVGGFVLDGFPRTVAQAAALDGIMAGRDPLIVVDIVVPEDELVRRLGTRSICDDVRRRRVGRQHGRRGVRQVRRRGWCSGRRQRGGRARAAEGVPPADGAARRVLPGRGRRSGRSTARRRPTAWRRIWRRRSKRRGNGEGAVGARG